MTITVAQMRTRLEQLRAEYRTHRAREATFNGAQTIHYRGYLAAIVSAGLAVKAAIAHGTPASPVWVNAHGATVCTDPHRLSDRADQCTDRGCAACFHQGVTEPRHPGLCPRCDGQGTIAQHSNVFDGVCFDCEGSGLSALGARIVEGTCTDADAERVCGWFPRMAAYQQAGHTPTQSKGMRAIDRVATAR